MTTINLDENENDKCVHIIHNWWHVIVDENLVVFTIGNVIPM
jgi:hypothetical protein